MSDLDAHARRNLDLGKPGAHHSLNIDAALRLDEKAPAVAPAQDRKRRRRRAERLHTRQLRRGARKGAGGELDAVLVGRGEDQRGEPAERRQALRLARLGLGGEEAVARRRRRCARMTSCSGM